jgi:hypothetical protein
MASSTLERPTKEAVKHPEHGLTQVEAFPRRRGTGKIAILDSTGDTKLIWDKANREEVEAAKATFDRLKKKGYLAYSVTGKEGAKGTVLREFDETAERMILAPPMQGG